MMAKRLRIKGPVVMTEPRIVDLEAARCWDYSDPFRLVVIENQLVRSFEELCRVVSRERDEYKEVFEVVFAHVVSGG